jgi:hypothetical protein
MAAKKREIYARAAVQLRTHERAFRAERICPGAMGLYLFLLLDSRGEQTAGDVAELVAVASWGGGESYRKKQAEALIAAGLVERRDDRLVVVKYEEHNDTPTDIEEARTAARQRKQSQRSHAHVTRDNRVSHAEVPISISSSLSESRSPESPEGHPSARARPDPASKPPDWWAGVLATLAMQAGVTLEAGPAWLRYAGHRHGKGLPATQQDALYWLTTVMVPEAKREAREATDRRERDAKFDREREAAKSPPRAPYHQIAKPPKPEDRASPSDTAAALRSLTATIGAIE